MADEIAAVLAITAVLLAALIIALLSWLSYYDVVTSVPHERCERTYLETFDDGEVLEAKRVLLPPSIKCTLRYPPTDEISVTHRPFRARRRPRLGCRRSRCSDRLRRSTSRAAPYSAQVGVTESAAAVTSW